MDKQKPTAIIPDFFTTLFAPTGSLPGLEPPITPPGCCISKALATEINACAEKASVKND